MSYRLPFVVCFVLLVGSLVLSLSGGLMQAQQAETAKPAASRYMIAASSSKGEDIVTVCDTYTGRCWSRSTVGKQEWIELGSPMDK